MGKSIFGFPSWFLHIRACTVSDNGKNALNVGFMMNRDCSICAANIKGADQLGIYCTADLRLCFPIRKTSFLMYGLRQFGHFGKTIFCHGIKLYHFCNM